MPAPIASPELLVNSVTSGEQHLPSIRALAGGGFVVVWQDNSGEGGDSSEYGVKGQRFDAAGNRLGGEFLVNTNTSGTQHDPYVASLPSGGFLVVWTDFTGDSSGWAVKARIYDAAGAPAGGEFLVNTLTDDDQWQPEAAALPSGGFLVTWSHRSGDSSLYAVKAQFFDAAGGKVGTEFLVNTTQSSYQDGSKIAVLESGNIVILWNDFSHQGGDGSGYSLKAQMYDSAGTRIGGEFLVNTTTQNDQGVPSMAALAGGGFVIAWMDNSGQGGDASGWSVRGQRFDAAGAKVGAEFLVNTATTGNQEFPSVVALADGGFAVSWNDSLGDSSGYGVKVQMYDSNGARVGGELAVNAVTAGTQFQSAMTAFGSGFAIAWSDQSGLGGDASGYAVKARTFTLGAAAINGTPGDDFIIGTPQGEVIDGLGGNDLILAGGGEDVLLGGDGDDTLEGNTGVDHFDGGAGFDRVGTHEEEATQASIIDLRTQTIYNDGYGNIETMTSIEAAGGGTRFADLFYGDDNRNLLVGSNGDTLYGFGGDDEFVVDGAPALLDGGPGSDRIGLFRQVRLIDLNGDGIGEMEATANGVHVDLSIGRIVDDGFGGSGDIVSIEHLGGSAGDDILRGDGGSNQLSGAGGDDRLEGAGGGDNLSGDDGDDSLDGGDGDDFLAGGGGGDILGGGEGEDNLDGHDGDDALAGGTGHDVLRGRTGSDSLDGGEGDDFVVGGFGDDLIDGGPGADRAGFSSNATGGVTVDLNLQGIAQNTGQGLDILIGIENVSGTRFDDTLIGDGGDNWISVGGDGSGVTGNNILFGGGGDDLIQAGTGNQWADGGSGIDALTFGIDGGPTDVTPAGVTLSLLLQGAAQDSEQGMMTLFGFENLSGSIYDDMLAGDGGGNMLAGSSGADRLAGGGGDDILLGDGRIGIDYHVTGGSGSIVTTDDVAAVFGEPAGNDVLDGGLGSDLLIGGGGDDRLTGGKGSDSFLFGSGSGHDRITDFETKDMIVIDVTGVNGFSDLTIGSDSQGNALISWGSGDSITLEGYKAKKLSAADFSFDPPGGGASFAAAEPASLHSGLPFMLIAADHPLA